MGGAPPSDATNSSPVSIHCRNSKKSTIRLEDIPKITRQKDTNRSNRRPRAREVSSKYLSSYSNNINYNNNNSSSSSSPNRSTSPLFSMASPSRLDHRRNHCTTRRFSVSFQGESFTLETSKPSPNQTQNSNHRGVDLDCSFNLSSSLSTSSDTDSVSSGSNSNLQPPPKLKVDGPLISPRTVLSTRMAGSPSIVNFAAEFLRMGKKGEVRVEDAHSLGLLHNRLLQWQYVNARVSSSVSLQIVTVERSILNSWLATTQLRDSIVMKKIMLHLLKRNMKLGPLLKEQMVCLEEWSLMDAEHTSSLNELIGGLKTSILRLPLVNGAKATIRDLKDAIGSAADMIQLIRSSHGSMMLKAEHTSSLVTELLKATSEERALLQEYRRLLCILASMHMKQCSLRAHLQQLSRDLPERKSQRSTL